MQFLSWSFIVFFLATGIATLSQYGLTIDEGSGNLFFGQRYFYFFSTFDDRYLDFERSDLPIHERIPNLFLSPLHNSPHEFPPVADTLSAATMELFSYRLHWLDPIDGFHLFTVILGAVLLIAVYLFARRYMAHYAAVMAILLLGLYPRFWADMHFNTKDICQMSFFALTIMAYFVWFKRPSRLRAVSIGILFGAALGTKANALFIPVVLVLGVWPWQARRYPWDPVIRHLRHTYLHYALMAIAAALFYFLSWPFLYADPKRALLYFEYIYSQGGREGELIWNWAPLVQAIGTMPELILIFLVVGVIGLICRRNLVEFPMPRLLLVWAFFPIVRASLPGMVNFDGIRHFQEFVPAVCIIAGYGMASLVDVLSPRLNLKRSYFALAVGLLFVFNTAAIVRSYYPFLNVYYNSLVGGLSGAHYRHAYEEATDYWASSYRQGMRWLNDNAVENSRLHVTFAPWTIELTAPLWLRQDIQLVDLEDLKAAPPANTPAYVMFVTRKAWYTPLARYASSNLVPIHEIVIDGTPILQIYELDGFPSELRNQAFTPGSVHGQGTT